MSNGMVLEWEDTRRTFPDPLVAADVLTHRMMWRAELRYREKTGRYNLDLTPRQRAAYKRTKARVLKIVKQMMGEK